MGLVALPLLMSFEELKTGWPPSIERVLSSFRDVSKSSDKKDVNCNSCDKKMKVPADYSGKISCPHCGSTMSI